MAIQKRKRSKASEKTWIKEGVVEGNVCHLVITGSFRCWGSAFRKGNIWDLFLKLFFTNEVISHLIIQTNLYARQDINGKDICVDEEYLTKFWGLLLLSGYHCAVRDKLFGYKWRLTVTNIFKVYEQGKPQICQEVLSCGRRQLYGKVKTWPRFYPWFILLRDNCQKHGIFDKFLSHGEAMIPYQGHHRA